VTIELARDAPSAEAHAPLCRTARRSRAFAVVAIVGLGIGACGDDDSSNAGSRASVDGASVDGAGVDGASVDVSDAWARSSPAGVTVGAAYMTIESAAGDQLVGALVPSDIAATVELHETVAGEGQDAAEMEGHETAATEGTGTAMTMRQVSDVELPSGVAVAFEPGGLHVMLIDLAGPLESGSSFELTLMFATAAPKTVSVVVRDEAP
jgi:copper(I)-binding protein